LWDWHWLAILPILASVNWCLWVGRVNSALVFSTPAFRSGDWWRLFTFPLVHLSWYHLLLDAGAFVFLYKGLAERRLTVRMLYCLVCGGVSLLFGLWLSPAVLAGGLSGLSGIAHGLMAVAALELIRDQSHRTLGIASYGAVVGKSIYEAATGNVAFEFMHLGLCGTPVAACHAGGVVGGLLCFWGVYRLAGWGRSGHSKDASIPTIFLSK
jgi:rhomboid family GlyGly-CTERM serine protease